MPRFIFYLPVALLLLILAAYCFGLRINLTPSMPIGFYYLKNVGPKRGDFVAVCLSSTVAKEGLRRHYLFYGHCREHSVPVLKQLIAVPGDYVQLSREGITVNKNFYVAPQLSFDSRQHNVRHFVTQPILSVVNKYWLYGSHEKQHSWDSRYWGGVEREDILGIYQPLWAADSGEEIKTSRHSSRDSPNKKSEAKPLAPG
ncbi:MAG: hypothetical protein A3F17_09285 [Gammaproteobacteria bacterium RIFCSPHIGHO2_12_FULL_41_15]|nr:MAG: hypothetical protein A3F17_09285 [Gammaproteobacteria bacterium RIFCSPHIGHO2_12_FULL_41_15]